MKTAPRHLLLGTALIALTGIRALADTSILGYGGPGNELNPNGQPLDLFRDPNGLSLLDDVTRTPTGLLYPLPYAYPAMTQSKSDPDIWSTGWIEGGWIGSFGLNGTNTKAASFQEYGDWSNLPIATSLGFLRENRKTAWFMSGLAENVGRDDQYYQLKTGRYGEYNFTLFFDSIPHVYSTQAKSLYNGVGTSNLTLRDGLVPGASTPTQVDAALAAAPNTELKITRQKAGFSASYTPWGETVEGYFQVSNEWRDGTQPISATFGYPFQNGATQIIAPIHYRTLDVTTALRWKEDDFQANLTYTGSFFRNSDESLTWQNPGLAQVPPGSYIPTEGLLSLPPSNDFNSLKGDVAWLLSPQLRFAASLSYSLMRQNEALLPPTIDSGTIPGAGGPINLADWNTTGALSRLNADAAINLFNAFAQLQYFASPDWSFDFELRDHEESNLTNYLSYNPITGQYGYIAIDGGLAPFEPILSGVYQPGTPGNIVQIRNMPFANDNLEVTTRASYRFDNHVKLDLSYIHNSIEHSVREVPNADDNRLRLQVAATGFEWGSIRVSYEYGHLLGSDYTADPYTAYYSQSLPGYVPLTPQGDIPFTMDNFRKFDVTNRVEHKLHAQSNYILSPRTDLQLTSDWKLDSYSADYGLHDATSFDINGDVNYQLSTTATLTGFLTWQVQHRSLSSINPQGIPGSGAAGGPDYPFSAAWAETLADNDYAAGFTAHKAWDKISLDFNYVYTRGDGAVGYSYASPLAFFYSVTPAQAGTSFPDIVYNSHSFEADLRWKPDDSFTWRLLYRMQFEHLDDFHYDGLYAGVINNNVYLGVVPENFTVQTIGVLAQYTF